jgi:uncharacterized protein (TIGR03663 family)
VITRPADLAVRPQPLVRARGWAATWWREAVPYAALTFLGLGLRLVQLGEKPFHHDEALHAWFSWQLVSGDGYRYDPVYHGPFQFYAIALSYMLFGIGDYVAHVGVAAVGTIAIFLPFFLRRQLGGVAALTASLAICLAPAWLYFSRFVREDIHVATITLGLIIVALRFFEQPRPWQPIAFGTLLALSFATKETTYITVAVFGLFFTVAVAVQALRSRRKGNGMLGGALLRGISGLGLAPWAWGVSSFLLVYTLLFSTFLTNPQGLQEGLWGSIDYWLGQQDVNRGSQPWFYYLIVIPAYEWPIVLLGLGGIVVALRRRTITDLFLVWTFVATLAVFSWASERMPWLVLHTLVPLTLLAGIGAQALWASRRRPLGVAAMAVVVLAAAGALYHSIGLSYFRSADPRELYVQVQTSDDLPPIRDRLMSLRAAWRREHGEPFVPVVDSWGGTGWPWSWYLRDVPSGFYDMSRPDQVQLGPLLLVADPSHDAMKPRLEGHTGEKFRLRVWWVPVWDAAGPGDWLRWAVSRKAWGPTPTATMDEWLYLSPELARLDASDK